MEKKEIFSVNDYCENRIKPQLIRDVKTEAILVFARTALERYFDRIDRKDSILVLKTEEDTKNIHE